MGELVSDGGGETSDKSAGGDDKGMNKYGNCVTSRCRNHCTREYRHDIDCHQCSGEETGELSLKCEKRTILLSEFGNTEDIM